MSAKPKNQTNVVQMPLKQVVPNQTLTNDRKEFDDVKLQQLAISIAENGLIQPATVRPLPGQPGMYEMIAGERRLRAHMLYTERVETGEWDESPLLKPGFIDCIVREMDDKQVAGVMLVENDQRVDLNPIERAKAYRLRIERFGYTVAELAELIGKSPRTIEGYLGLLDLIDEAQALVRSEALPVGHARLMVDLDVNRQQMALRLLAGGKRVTYDMFQQYVSRLLEEQSQQSMFDLTQFWVEQVNEAEDARQTVGYDLPVRRDLPPVVIEPKDTSGSAIRRYINDLLAAGYRAEGEAIGTLLEALMIRRKVKS
ncbi:MAG TPA: ParB/RepB/Spo0J family partition protein [Anaerolineae bacterium]